MIERTRENVYHDDFSECNQPFYFYQFAEMLAESGMQYISEAEEGVSNTGTLSPEALGMLDSVASDLIEREQYLDFIRCRRFRSTLFCRKDIALDRNYLRDHADEFYFAGRMRYEEAPPTVDSDDPETFLGPTSEKVKCNHPLTKAAIRYLSDQWTRSVRFDELIEGSVERYRLAAGSKTEADVARTRDFLIELFRVGMFRVRVTPSPGVAQGGSKPTASRFARWQIERGSRSVMTLTGLSLEVDDDIARLIIILADGTRDRDELVRAVIENLEAPKGDKNEFRAMVTDRVELNLRILGTNGLLEA